MKIRLLQQLRSDDRGQGALEYIGILAVVALVITIAIGAFQGAEGSIQQGLQGLIDKVFAAGA